ncbi:MAG: hypothetical protein GEV08_23655 [Acidimicrobiia bacterium]|nr:hypothetical protein [Acidimicrobiia bacterium]
MTSAFVDGAELMAQALGATGYPFAVISHPISSAGEAELVAKARATIEQAQALLLSGDEVDGDARRA